MGVHLLQLIYHHVLDNCVIVNGNHRMVLDSTESNRLALSAEVLSLCGGDSASNFIV